MAAPAAAKSACADSGQDARDFRLLFFPLPAILEASGATRPHQAWAAISVCLPASGMAYSAGWHEGSGRMVSSQSDSAGRRRLSSRAIWLRLGWLILLLYVLWVAHNALPWLGSAPPPSAPAIIAQLIALPAGISAPGIPLPTVVAELMALLFLILVALTVSRPTERTKQSAYSA